MINKIIKGLCLFALAGAALLYIMFFREEAAGAGQPEGYRLSDTGVGVKYDYDSQASFYSYNSKNFFFCTKDGMKYYSVASTASQKWGKVFSMASPKMVGECGIVAVAEERGKIIYVFNEDGLMYEKNFEYPILSFSVNKTGYLSAILQNGDGYEIVVFTGTGAPPSSEKLVHNDYNIFPVSCDISNDGRMLAVSFIDINSVQVYSKVVFWYLNMDESRKSPDGMFASQIKESEYIMSVKFMENNSLLAFSDCGIYCYAAGDNDKVTDKWGLQLGNKLDAVSFYGEKSFAVAYGDVLLNKEGEKPGTVKIYGVNGLVTGEYKLESRATYLSAGANGVIAGSNRNYSVISNKGQLLWAYSAIQDIRQFIFLENTNSVLFAGNLNAQVMKWAKAKASADSGEL